MKQIINKWESFGLEELNEIYRYKLKSLRRLISPELKNSENLCKPSNTLRGLLVEIEQVSATLRRKIEEDNRGE